MSFQAPPEIPGVKNNLFIRTALNAVREARGEAPLDAFDFLGDARAAAARLGLPTVEINPGETLLSDLVRHRIEDRAAPALDALGRALGVP